MKGLAINLRQREVPDQRKPGRLAYALIGFLLLSLALLILVSTLDDMGLTDDDDFYVPAGIDYIKWVRDAAKGAVKGDFSAFSKAKVERRWRNNHEHPAVAKLAIGFGWLVFYDGLGWLGQIDAGRMGIILFSLFLLYLVFRLSWESFGPYAAVFSVLALLGMPRTFFHMHVGTLDLATATTVFWVVYAAWRAERRRAWVVWTGVVFGVALCTKLNGPFVVFPLVAYWLYRWWRIALLGPAAGIGVRRFFAIGGSMALLSFPVFFALWPWIWHNSLDKLWDYFNFHFHHYGIKLLYLGSIYDTPFAPWHAPFVYLLFTVPLLLLLLGGFGFWRGLRQLRPENLTSKSAPPIGEEPGGEADVALLMAINAFFAVAIVAFPNNPKYGGVKLFQPFFPFFAVLAGYGFELLRRHLAGNWSLFKRTAVLSGAVLGVLLLLPGALAMGRVYPYMLSYYNELAGGPRGAAEMGLERQYYDMCYRSMIDYWNENGPKRATISYEPNVGEYQRTYPWYKRDHKLTAHIRVSRPKDAEFMVLTHERRWEHYFPLLNAYRRYPELHTKTVWGLPLYTIYALKPGAEKRKPTKSH